jgi:prolyl oligopeptidase
MPDLRYPPTERLDIVEDHFGQAVADPYRWLENDIRTDADVAAWVERQNVLTQSYLATLPGRDTFADRLDAMLDYEQYFAPIKRGGRYFFTRNAGQENQATLYLRSADGTERVIIDPNSWSVDNADALAEWTPSDDGRLIAYAVQTGGTDWRTIKILDVETGTVRDDTVEWARFTQIAWASDGSGFFYARFPEPQGEDAATAGVSDHAVYFHALGTAQAADRLVYATPETPTVFHVAGRTDDGRYLVIYSTPGAGVNALTVIDLTDPAWTPRRLVETFDAEWTVIGNQGETLFLQTTDGAERRRIVTLDLARQAPEPVEIIAEDNATLTTAALLGGRLLTTYLVDAQTEVRRFTTDGTPDGIVDLPGIGTAGGFQGEATDPEAFFIFSSYDTPMTILRYDVAENSVTVWAKPRVPIDIDSIVVEQHLYTSPDGTRVPLFTVRRKDVVGPAPTILYGYGGFGISMVPVYNPAQMAWVEQGGVFAVANIRGGGEYGRAWHVAGQGANKQNVFDDFIAAGEYLKAQGITSADGLVAQGESNGGLLVGAVVNQRPDLFAAALPGVGVMDMLRFHRYTGGSIWMVDFGDPREEAHFKTLLDYSPYHTIRAGTDYPAILATTADTDDRVVPGHTFKYVAALQAADLGPAPRLARIETRAGHGAGMPRDKTVALYADMWAFAARWTGLEIASRD